MPPFKYVLLILLKTNSIEGVPRFEKVKIIWGREEPKLISGFRHGVNEIPCSSGTLRGVALQLFTDCLHRCTVHFVVYLINTPTKAHI